MLIPCGSIGNARKTNIANAKRRTLPVAKRSVENVNGLENESFSKHVSVTSKLNTNRANTSRTNTSKTNTDLGPGGCHHILPRVISQGPSRHTRPEDNSQDTGPFPPIKVEGLYLASDKFLHTMQADSSQANDPFPRTMQADSSPVRDLFPRTMQADSSPVRDLFLRTTPEERCPVSGPFRLTMVVEPCQAISRFLLTTKGVRCLTLNQFLPTTQGVSCRARTNPSPLITSVEISQGPILPRTTPTLTMGPLTMKLRREWVIWESVVGPLNTILARRAPGTSLRLVVITLLVLPAATTPRPPFRAIVPIARLLQYRIRLPQEIHTIVDLHPRRTVPLPTSHLPFKMRLCFRLPKVSVALLMLHSPTPTSITSRSRILMS